VAIERIIPGGKKRLILLEGAVFAERGNFSEFSRIEVRISNRVREWVRTKSNGRRLIRFRRQ
jgi:hypothetical protein